MGIFMILLEFFEVFGMVDCVFVMREGWIIVEFVCEDVISENVMFVVIYVLE